jgi:hypothetical protein
VIAACGALAACIIGGAVLTLGWCIYDMCRYVWPRHRRK